MLKICFHWQQWFHSSVATQKHLYSKICFCREKDLATFEWFISERKKGKNVALFWNLFRLIFLSSISLSSSSRIVMFRVLLLRFSYTGGDIIFWNLISDLMDRGPRQVRLQIKNCWWTTLSSEKSAIFYVWKMKVEI